MTPTKKSHLCKKVAFKYFIRFGYFLFNQSPTASGAIIDSTNVYAPVFSDFTILMAFVKRLDPVCNDATDFFAMINLFVLSAKAEI